MENYHRKEYSFTQKLFAFTSLILVVMGFILMANAISGIVMKLFLSKPLINGDLLSSGIDSAILQKILIYAQLAGAISCLIILPLLYIHFIKKDIQDTFYSFNQKDLFQFYGIAILITFAAIPLIGIIADWNKNMNLPESLSGLQLQMKELEEKAEELTKLIVGYNNAGEFLLVLLTVAIVPAIGEEIVFRGFVQNELINIIRNPHISILITAAIFSFIHFQFFGFFPRMLLGIILGYLYFWSGNITVSILMHFTNNAMAVIAMNMYKKGYLNVDLESAKDIPLESIFASILLCATLMYLCYNLYKKRTDIKENNVFIP